MISVLLPGLALMVLFGEISGRSTVTRLLTFSCFRLKTWVRIWSPERTTWPTETVPVCSLASASGTTLSRPETSMTVKPRPRSADMKFRKASRSVSGCSL